jgi:hypothetical protein
MANWKSDALACPRGAAEPLFMGIHKPFETLEFREPYRIRGVQSFGDKWAFRRITSAPCREGVRSSNEKIAAAIGLESLRNFGGEYAASTRWRRERNWGRTFSTWANVEESNPAYGAPAGGPPRLGQWRAMLGKDDNERLEGQSTRHR